MSQGRGPHYGQAAAGGEQGRALHAPDYLLFNSFPIFCPFTQPAHLSVIRELCLLSVRRLPNKKQRFWIQENLRLLSSVG